MNATDYAIRKGAPSDVDAIKTIADAHRRELGFVLRPALVKSIDRAEVLVCEKMDRGLIGFIEYHHRRDRQTTVYHIVVVSSHRRKGVGKALIDAMHSEALALGKQAIRLKCPIGLVAHDFYDRLGFKSLGEETGKGRPLVVWQLPVSR